MPEKEYDTRQRVKPRVFILGSCVTRDAFEIEAGRDFEIAGYICRTSLASAFAPKVDWPPVPPLESGFEQKMLDHDLNKTALTTIQNTEWDILVVDLIDERFNILTDGRAVVTESSCFFKAKQLNFYAEYIGMLSLPIGNLKRQHLWTLGVRNLFGSLDLQIKKGKSIIVNCAQWANRTEEGGMVKRPQELISANNMALRSMYRVMERTVPTAVEFIRYPDDIVRSADDHRWGPAPFHYGEGFYENFLTQLSSIHDAKSSRESHRARRTSPR